MSPGPISLDSVAFRIKLAHKLVPRAETSSEMVGKCKHDARASGLVRVGGVKSCSGIIRCFHETVSGHRL